MRKIIFLVFAFIGLNVYSQNLTQKYNSLLNQYEFFDEDGNMIGYKKWNSLLEQWEYYSKTSEKKSHYIDPIDNKDLERTMQQLENNYDYNYKIVSQKVNEMASLFDSFTYDMERFKKSKYFGPVMELFKSFQKTIENLDNSNLNFSKKSTGRYYLNQIMPYQSRLRYLKANYEAEQTPIKEPPIIEANEKITKTEISKGGYESEKILEFKLNPENNEFEKTNELDINCKLFLDDNQYAFKRGNNKWLYAKWSFEKYDQDLNRYYFYDNYGQRLVFNLKEMSITWYMNRNENNVFQNIVKYVDLRKSNLIKPE